MEAISENLYLFRDTCHVYVVRSGASAVLVDFGDGAVLDALPSIGVQHVTDVLLTHHHRDQCQGLHKAIERGARVWAPHAEQDLFSSVDQHWQARPLLNNYDVRQDRFSLLEPVCLSGTLKDYRCYTFGGRTWTVLPTPGHTPGSLSLLVEIDGQLQAFTGDLIAGPGKVWSMAALQWSYHAMAGAAASIPALLDLARRSPVRLLPSHGEIMDHPQAAIDLLVARLRLLLDSRRENLCMDDWLRRPYEAILPHLLRNRTSVSNSYVLLSESGSALLLDYGYDFLTTLVPGADRALHRPWLYTLDTLKRDFGVKKIDVAVSTHYHDDHVAGFNLLREVEGTQVWTAGHIATVLERPDDYDLPCLWYDPVPVDRILIPGQPVPWEEYTLAVYPLPGHTRYAAAILFEVDGRRVLVTGDQYQGNDGLDCNYVYQNGFSLEDFCDSAALYERLAPDLILPGHWEPLWVDAGYFTRLREQGEKVAWMHRDLLPLDTLDLGGEDRPARIIPYHAYREAGKPILYRVEVRNPLPQDVEVQVRLALPAGWQADPDRAVIPLRRGASGALCFQVSPPPGLTGRRFRLAVDLTANTCRLGQQAEALVDLLEPGTPALQDTIETHSVR